MESRPRFLSFATGFPPTSGGHEKPSPALPMLTLPTTFRNNAVAVLGEFVGTFLFLFFAFAGTQIANTPSPDDVIEPTNKTLPNLAALIFIALAFGGSLTANVWAFYRVTGGAFNPAVTLALFLVGGLPFFRSVLVIISQLLGGIAAAAVVTSLFPGPMVVETTLGNGTTPVQGLFIEMFLTAELVFVIIMVAAEKHKGTYMAPVAIGLAFFLTQLVGVNFTGGSLNPARSLGPAVVHSSFPSYHWIYWIGPLLGALIASAFYSLLKYLRWKECNPGQDWNDIEKREAKRLHGTGHGRHLNSTTVSDDPRASAGAETTPLAGRNAGSAAGHALSVSGAPQIGGGLFQLREEHEEKRGE